jgi:four helix bundle protein
MENVEMDFNQKYSLRSKVFAVNIIHFYSNNCKKNEELRVIGKQLLRSGTSVAANFRAYTRGRSKAERFAKICIVVEEADETLFWLELLEEASLIDLSIFASLKQEALELLKIFSSTKFNLK